MASLNVLQVRNQQRLPSTLSLLKSTTVFGRDTTCDCRLDWDGCSRTHFTIHGQQPDGSGLPTIWLLVDEGDGNNNGVFVNGRRVARATLRDGDLIGVGRGRDVREGGKISDRNLEYVFQIRTIERAGKGRVMAHVEENLADKGAHRQLRGESRHPLGGHSVASALAAARVARAELPAGENFAPCRAKVYPPSNYRKSPADNRPPRGQLELEYVYGIRSHDTSGCLHYVSEDHVLYPAGAIVILHDMSTNTQSFFFDHDDDVVALALHPSRNIAASGQVASIKRVTSDGHPSASIMIWKIDSMARDSRTWPSRGVLSREFMHRILALDFDLSGSKLVAFGGKHDASARIIVYDWRAGKIIFALSASSCIVTAVKHNPANPFQFVQCTEKTVRLWDYKIAEKDPAQASKSGSYLKFAGKNVQSNAVTFTLDGQAAIVAMANGCVYFFGNKGSEVTVIAEMKGIHEGEVFAVLHAQEHLVTAGEDGYIKVWEYEWGGERISNTSAPRLIGQVSLRPFASSGFEKVIAARNVDYFRGKLIVATNTNLVLEVTLSGMGVSDHTNASANVHVIRSCHAGEGRNRYNPSSLTPVRVDLALNGLTFIPSSRGASSTLFCTTGEDRTLRIWNANQRNIHTLGNGKRAIVNTGMPGTCCNVSSDAKLIAVGHAGGQFTVWDSTSLLCYLENSFRKRRVSVVRFSSDSKWLLVCTHENSLDCYSVKDNFRHAGADHVRHSAAITAADWSQDGTIVRTSDVAGEQLFWHMPACKGFKGNSSDLRDMAWATHTCLVSWDKKSIWGPGYSISDINAVDVSPSERSLITGEDDGCMRMFRYPAVGDEVQSFVYAGHSSAIQAIVFSADERYVLSVGGYDLCIFQWRHIMNEPREGRHASHHSAGPLGMRAN